MPKQKWSEQTPESLMSIATELERTASQLRVRASELQTDGFKQLPVPNYEILMRGMAWIERFAFSVRKAHIDAKEMAGAYNPPKRRRSK